MYRRWARYRSRLVEVGNEGVSWPAHLEDVLKKPSQQEETFGRVTPLKKILPCNRNLLLCLERVLP
jgi:hypothetical protein